MAFSEADQKAGVLPEVGVAQLEVGKVGWGPRHQLAEDGPAEVTLPEAEFFCNKMDSLITSYSGCIYNSMNEYLSINLMT